MLCPMSIEKYRDTVPKSPVFFNTSRSVRVMLTPQMVPWVCSAESILPGYLPAVFNRFVAIARAFSVATRA